MTSHATDIEYYYDSHPTKEDLMGDSIPQFQLVQDLLSVLNWYYSDQKWLILGNVNIYQTNNPEEYPVAPDVAVWVGRVMTEAEEQLRSWRVRPPDYPPPTVVFEVASGKTWQKDLNKKIRDYAKMGVKEYYAYDPNKPPLWKRSPTRIRGWKNEDGAAVEMARDERGWLWSEALDSWLVPNGARLRLADRDGNHRLTEAEAAKAERRNRYIEQRRREKSERLAQEAEARAQAELRAKEEAERQAQEAEARARAERQAREAEHAANEVMRVKLRELGFDPDKLT